MTVDQYLKDAPLEMQPLLRRLRTAILASAPNAEETISYNIPTYKYKGTLVHFAAFKNHCSLIVVNKEVIPALKEDLEDFKISGTTIHLSPSKMLSTALIRKIIRIRLRQNENLAELEARVARKNAST